VIPVNPRESEILGEKCYASLADIPEPVDVVNVFRAPDALPGIARETVAIGAGTLWCQFGVINLEGAKIAEDGGVTVIMDRCLKVEHARYVGRMHWLGFNTQRITSVRAGLQLPASNRSASLWPQRLTGFHAAHSATTLLSRMPQYVYAESVRRGIESISEARGVIPAMTNARGFSAVSPGGPRPAPGMGALSPLRWARGSRVAALLRS